MGPDRLRCNALIQNSMAEHGLNQKCLRTFLQRESFVVHAVISRALDDCAFQLPPCQGEVQFQHGLAWLEPTAAGHPQEFRRSAGVTSRMSSLGFGRSTHTTQGILRGASTGPHASGSGGRWPPPGLPRASYWWTFSIHRTASHSVAILTTASRLFLPSGGRKLNRRTPRWWSTARSNIAIRGDT